MNKLTRSLVCSFVILAALSLAVAARAQKQTPSGESFYIVSSIDPPKSEVLLKRPTEVTELLKVTSATKCLDEKGKAISLSDLRAGDTVWVRSTRESSGQATALSIRKGPMTVAELHQLYLDYPEIH